jgi:hypothetical protein
MTRYIFSYWFVQKSDLHNSSQFTIITYHYFSLPICAGRDSTRENTEVWVEDVEKRLLWINTFNHMRGTKCDEWMLSENQSLPTIHYVYQMLSECWWNYQNVTIFFTSQGHQKGPDQLALEHPYGEFDDGFWKVERVLICFGKQWKTIHILGYIISIPYKTIYMLMGIYHIYSV